MRTVHRYSLLVLSGLFLLISIAGAEPRVWPKWSAPTATGTDFHSSRLDGKVAVLSMWGSWCPSCRKQLPILDKLQSFLGKEKVQIVGFSFDRTNEKHKLFIAEKKIQVPSIFARSGEGLEVVKMLQNGAGRLEAVPTVLIYDKQGRLAHRLVGFFNRKQLEELIQPLLEE